MARWGRFEDNLSNIYLEAARGEVHGAYVEHKFGFAEDIDVGDGVVDIWDGAANDLGGKINPYNWIDDGPVDIQVTSTSDLDIGVPLSGEGLDQNWTRQVGTAVLNGQTPVPVGFQRNRIYRAYNAGNVDLVGNVYISDAGTPVTLGVPDDPTKVRAIIHNHAQQTQMALWTVPAGHSAYITEGWANLSKQSTTEAIVTIYMREFGGVFRITHTLSLQTSGSSGDHRPYAIPLRMPEKTDIIYRAQVYSNSSAVAAGFHALVIKN